MALWDRKRADEEITLYEELLGRLQRALHANGSRSYEDPLNDKILDVETLARTTVVPDIEWRLKALLWQLNDFDAVAGNPAEWKKILHMLAVQKAMPSLKYMYVNNPAAHLIKGASAFALVRYGDSWLSLVA